MIDRLTQTTGDLIINGRAVREDFPILHQQVQGNPLVYLDNAATTQKPQAVIDAVARFYRCDNANVHRGIHTLSERATAQFEAVRSRIQAFIGACSHKEIVFCRGATEAINLVAYSYLRPRLQAGDEILLSELEHHANIVPWQLIAEQTKAKLVVIPLQSDGSLDINDVAKRLSTRTRLLAISHVSNVLGTIIPIQAIVELAHAQKVPVLVDGAQAVSHVPVDVQQLGCDFYVFSGHKLYAPTGIGVLYGKLAHLESMRPYQGGGEMIQRVSFTKTEYQSSPYKFEAGTQPLANVIGLGAAIDYIHKLGLQSISDHEARLLEIATDKAQSLGLKLLGTAAHKVAILTFVMDGIHAHDVGTALDSMGIAVRAGHHCAMPVMDYYQVPAAVRASFAFYNTEAEVEYLFESLEALRAIFKR